jgi:hypothetical protein
MFLYFFYQAGMSSSHPEHQSQQKNYTEKEEREVGAVAKQSIEERFKAVGRIKTATWYYESTANITNPCKFPKAKKNSNQTEHNANGATVAIVRDVRKQCGRKKKKKKKKKKPM